MIYEQRSLRAPTIWFGLGWFFRDFVDSSDPRFRSIVSLFEKAGYVQKVKDEFV